MPEDNEVISKAGVNELCTLLLNTNTTRLSMAISAKCNLGIAAAGEFRQVLNLSIIGSVQAIHPANSSMMLQFLKVYCTFLKN